MSFAIVIRITKIEKNFNLQQFWPENRKIFFLLPVRFSYLCRRRVSRSSVRRVPSARKRGFGGPPKTRKHVARSRHSRSARLHRPALSHRMALGASCRQRRLLHGQPPLVVVRNRPLDDYGRHVGRDLPLGTGVGGGRLLLLHADGAGLHGGAARRRLPPCPSLLPHAGPGRGSSSSRRCSARRCASTSSAP